MGERSGLPEKIAAWLAKQGYPLEMEAVKAFHSSGFDTTQSAYYMDTESGDSRETDVVASQCANVSGVLIHLSVVVECKKTDGKPWLLFSTGHDQLPNVTCVAQRASSLAGRKALLALMEFPAIQKSPLFVMGDNTGYSVMRAFAEDNSDPAYKALMSVCSATRSMTLYSDGYSLEQKKVVKVRESYAHVLFPVVVIGSSLWQCSMKEDCQGIDVTKIDCGVLVWKNPFFSHPHTIVHIVTREHLKSFAADAAKTWLHVREASEGLAKDSIAAIPKMFVEKRKARVVTSIPI